MNRTISRDNGENTMYVLSRQCNESVIVDGFNGSTREIKVTVLQVKGGKVQLGFEVNSDVPRLVGSHRNESTAGSGATVRRQMPRALLRGVFNESETSKDRPVDWGHARPTKAAGSRGSEQEVMMQ
jgi:sRNA-binding carbon storage regulator CsrA